MVTSQSVIKKLKSEANSQNVAGMARFGINPKTALGIQVPVLRRMAKDIKKDSVYRDSKNRHRLAKELWKLKIHEARLLAGMIADANLLTKKEMDAWVRDFDSWDVCDQACLNIFCNSKFAIKKCIQWSKNKREFVRRAGFALMACLAFKNKILADEDFKKFFPVIEKYSFDERNYVRKAVNWALRQIGKRNKNLNKLASETAKEILKQNTKSAKWIASDALRELQSAAVKARLKQ